jgi:hypothetical protein
MGEYRDLISRTLIQLDEQADTIVNHIARLVSEADPSLSWLFSNLL